MLAAFGFGRRFLQVRRCAGVALVAAFAVALAGPLPAHAAITPTTNAQDVANAMSAQGGLVTGASWVFGPSAGNAAGTSGPYGIFMPMDGTTFGVLTTGSVAIADPPNNSESAGADNGTATRGVNDVSILKVDVNVPTGSNCIGFDAVFYSEEFREFIGSMFNDAFLAEIDANTWTYDPGTNTVTAPANFAFDTNGRQLTVNSALVSSDDTQLQYDGSTVLLTARTPVTAGAHSIYFTIFDAGDHIFDTAVFLDNLRAANVPANQCVAGASAADTDGDGLRDAWERDGLDTNGDGTADLDLPAMGADPNHKDLFVEIDSMTGHQLPNAAINTVVTAFGNAPVSNPDGATGVRLHVDNGSTSIMNPATGATWGARTGANTITHRNVVGSYTGSDYNWSAFDTIKNANLASDRWPVFRYTLSIHRYGSASEDSSGIARGIPGSDLIVALGRPCGGGVDCTVGGTGGQAGTFMHELGHDLGLSHGGNVGTHYKPNYLSIMNYSFQFPGLRTRTTTGIYDYSRYGASSAAGTLANLDETSLAESSGLTATGAAANFRSLYYCGEATQGPFNMNTAVDWNCDGSSLGAVATSINQDAAQETLGPWDDWANIRYKGGAVGGLGLAALLPAQSEKLDTEPYRKLQKIGRVLLGDSKKPKIKVTGRRGSRKFKVRATDNRALDQIVVAIGKKKKIKLAKGKRKRVMTMTVKGNRRKVRGLAIDKVGNVSKVARAKRRR